MNETEIQSARGSDLVRGVPEKLPAPDCFLGVAHGCTWLCKGCMLQNMHGCVVEADQSSLDWLAMTAEVLRDQPFCEVLWLYNPQWAATMTALLAKRSSFGCVELEDGAEQPSRRFAFETAQRGGPKRFVWFRANLPTTVEHSENGADNRRNSEIPSPQSPLQLARAEEQLINLVQRWPGVIFSQRPDLSFQFVNDRIEEWTGISVAEWHGEPKRFREVIHECDDGELQQQLQRSAGTTAGSTATFRIRHVKTGRVIHVLEHREAVIGSDGALLGYEGVWADISRETIAEKRLATASWMETLAVLTAGLAHDFSNVIAGVQALSEAFQAQLPKDHPIQEGLGLIKNSTQSAIQIVRRILSLHQGKVGSRSYYDLNELVKELIELVRITVPRRVELQVYLETSSLPVYADAVELRQVFVNLVLNAVEAMPERGRLIIRTARYDQPPTATHMRGALPAGPGVCLQVQDEGMGIPARHLETIFDPFFTTKPGNKGSGLGLYNARLFAEKHRGAISVASKENVGTTFCLWLPQSDFTEVEREHQPPRLSRRTLLLIGPSEKGVNDTAIALRQQGHYVVTVASGENPQELLSSPNYEFSAVFALATSRETVPDQLFHFIRAGKLGVKTILQIVGCDRDEFTAPTLDLVDLVMAAETSAPELLAKVNTLLEGDGGSLP